MKTINFKIDKKISGSLGRAGQLKTSHGIIKTPSFVVVGTKSTVKALTPEQVKDLGAQVILANTYHLYLQPGDKLIRDAGGLHKFMNWPGPMMTDSGGFQVFSLGVAFGTKISKISSAKNITLENKDEIAPSLTKIEKNGVSFKSHIDGSSHFITPEKSIKIQHNLGADIIFAFDECTSPIEDEKYQEEALGRTHAWAERSLEEHRKLKGNKQIALFGIVQGGRSEKLRKKSAEVIGFMDFDGFGIGGSFDKEDMSMAVKWVNEILPEDKPRHLLGIGEPEDLLMGIENGVDLFDCVGPTRLGRNGTLFTKKGKINVANNKFIKDFNPIEKDCQCYTCKSFSLAYLSHLFRAKEMLGATLASIHNEYFINKLVADIRQAILDDKFFEFKKKFLKNYKTR